MEKYLQHGLSRQEDDILGAFGEGFDYDEIEARSFSPEYRRAFASLVRKGLLTRKFDENENITYVLTRKGKALWKVRAKEERLMYLKERTSNVLPS